MPIPTQHDRDLGKIDELANSIKGKLTVMRHAGDARRDFSGLGELVEEYVDRVRAFAHGTAPN